MATEGEHTAVEPDIAIRSSEMTSGYEWVAQRLRWAVCAVRGHETLLQFGAHRMSLRCIDCGHETTGWTIGEPPCAPSTPPPSNARIETRHAA
ncbi:MAG TPA: hypothetical protein VN654_25125 [Vicinamibacterales bacterium]|jgi:hypothetical protein|nr:hypothetical protein [Vicinamibacterales bacterium]